MFTEKTKEKEKKNGNLVLKGGEYDKKVPALKVPVQMGVAAYTELTFHKDLYEMGRQAALKSGDTRVNEEHLASLEEHAEAMAKEQAATLFNPEESEHDRLLKEKFENAKIQRLKIEKEIELAEEDVRKRRDALAELGEVPRKPSIPKLLFVIATLTIGLTIAPTFHDFFFSDLENQGGAWFFSAIIGLFCGGGISYCLLGTFEATAGKRAIHWVGLFGGLLFGLGVGVIRLIGAENSIAYILAIGLALIEIGMVVLLHWVGEGLRHQYEDFELRNKEYSRRLKVFQSAETNLNYWKEKQNLNNNVMADHTQHLYEREARFRQIENLINGVKKAVRDGCMAGIAENEGRVRGPNL